MRTVQNKIIVKPCEGDQMSEGGIIVPESFRGRSSKAKIIAVGDKVREFKAGYTVWHIKGAGQEIEDNGEKYFVMPETDVLGYLPN